jgi:adenine C2-methylase RlmN of 23S rRNA A2503 and tRNA A37
MTIRSEIIHSDLDKSFNVIRNGFEARFVQRKPNYFIIYVSTHAGCNQGCKMCHLTATKQTDMREATEEELLVQVSNVIIEGVGSGKINAAMIENITKIHVNFMARGEPLLNKEVTTNWFNLTKSIGVIIKRSLATYLPNGSHVARIGIRFNISTILPKKLLPEYDNIFKNFVVGGRTPVIYWSAYPTEYSTTRKKWIGNGVTLLDGIDVLKKWREYNTRVKIKIHFALIEGVTDDIKTHEKFIDNLVENGLRTEVEINFVSYNPYSEEYSKAVSTEVADEIFLLYHSSGYIVKSIPRVGTDVYASCGMFTQ